MLLCLMMWGPLMLLSVLPDLYIAQCPVTLDPPELVQELGESTVINCTSPVDGHLGITWKYGNKTRSEHVATFVDWDFEVTTWETKAQCSIQVNNTYYCTKDLQITVYKRPSSVTVVGKSLASKETPHELQCKISDVAPVRFLTVTWYKNDTIMKTEQFESNASTPTSVSSSVTWNVSREDDGALITCDAHLDLGESKPVVSNNTIKLSVEYAPMFQVEREHILLNVSHRLLCEALGNPPPQYNWTKDGKTVAENTQHLNVNVTESTTFHCVASNRLGSANKEFNVTAMETTTAPHSPLAADADCPLTITPDEIVVDYGGSFVANCSTSAKNSMFIGWEASTDGIGPKNVIHLPWRLGKVKDWTISASCYVTRQDGSQCEKPINVTVYKTADDVQVSSVGGDVMLEGSLHQLRCQISNVAPVSKVQVKWYRGDVLIHTERFNGSDSGPMTVFSSLPVTAEKEHNGANFTCETELLLGQNGPNTKVQSAPYTANVQYAPLFSTGSITQEFRPGENLSLACDAEGNPPPELQWKHPPAANVKHDTRERKIYINVTGATSSDAGVYFCNATNKVGSSSRTVTLIMKETTITDKTLMWLILPITVLCIMFVGVLCHRCKKKQGHYTVAGPSDSALPLTTKSAVE